MKGIKILEQFVIVLVIIMAKKSGKKSKKHSIQVKKTAAMKKAPGVCPECGFSKFYEDESRGERTCARCGLVLEESMVDSSQEWRAFDDEQRSKRARTGAPLTFSVDYREPIIIKEEEEVNIVKIGEFVDRLTENNKGNIEKQGILEVLRLPENKYFAVSFDRENNIDFFPIKEVSRHSVENVFEIEIESGSKIMVTGSHSIFSVSDNKILERRVDELKKGDFLVSPKFLPSGNIDMEIDMIEKFSEISKLHKNIYLRHISDKGFFEKLEDKSAEIGIVKEEIKNWKRHFTVPMHVLGKADFNWRVNGERIGMYSSPAELPLKVGITREFCRLLGLYVAEGSALPHKVIFSFGSHEKEYIGQVKSLIKSIFNLDAKEYAHDTATQLEINSSLLSLFFSEILKAGKSAKEKRVPPIIFSLPEEMKLSFIRGYIDGDGHVWNKGGRDVQVGASSASEELLNDISMVYLQLGACANFAQATMPSHTIKKTGQVLPESKANMLRITNPDIAMRLGFVENIPSRQRKGAIEELIPAPLKYKSEWKSRSRIRIGRELAKKIAKKHNDIELLKLAQSPFIFLRVKKITEVKPTGKYAYDLSVPECENFAGKIFYHNTKHDKGLTTEIGKGSGELFKVPSNKRAQYYRLTKWQKRLIESKDRNLSFALSELQRLISFLGLHRGVHESVAKKYEQAVDRGLVRGRSMESVIAALLYAVCRELGTPRTLEEISEASGVDKREIGRTYRYISREISIRILPASPEHYVPRFSTMLGLSDKTQARSIQILKKAKARDVTSGKGPTGVAAAALYIAAVLNEERKTQREIADAVGVTEVTIRNRFKEIVDKLGIAEEVEKKVKEEGLE